VVSVAANENPGLEAHRPERGVVLLQDDDLHLQEDDLLVPPNAPHRDDLPDGLPPPDEQQVVVHEGVVLTERCTAAAEEVVAQEVVAQEVTAQEVAEEVAEEAAAQEVVAQETKAQEVAAQDTTITTDRKSKTTLPRLNSIYSG